MNDHLEPHELELMALFDRDLNPSERERLIGLLNEHPELAERYAFYLHLQDLKLEALPPSNPGIRSRLMKHATRKTRAIRLQAWWHAMTARLAHPAIAGPMALCLVFLIGYEVLDTQGSPPQSLVELSIEQTEHEDEQPVQGSAPDLIVAKPETGRNDDANALALTDDDSPNLTPLPSTRAPVASSPSKPVVATSDKANMVKSKSKGKPAKKSFSAKNKGKSSRTARRRPRRARVTAKKRGAKAVEIEAPKADVSLDTMAALKADNMATEVTSTSPSIPVQPPSVQGTGVGEGRSSEKRPNILYMGPPTDDDELEARAEASPSPLSSDLKIGGRQQTYTTAEKPRSDLDANVERGVLSTTERRLLFAVKKDQNLRKNESKFLLRVARLAFRAGDYENARQWTLWVIRRNDDQLKPALELQRKIISTERR